VKSCAATSRFVDCGSEAGTVLARFDDVPPQVTILGNSMERSRRPSSYRIRVAFRARDALGGPVSYLASDGARPNCRAFLDALPPRAADSGSLTKEGSVPKFTVALVVAVLAVVTAAATVAGANSLDPRALSQARTIKAEITARYVRTGGPKLAVTEASSTGVIESFLLLTADFLGLQVVPADNGLHYAICPVRATSPNPGPRSARPASGFAPRRLALELAVRTFLETSASVVSVSLPTRDYVFFSSSGTSLRTRPTWLRWRER
jgi:hypothetical protein